MHAKEQGSEAQQLERQGNATPVTEGRSHLQQMGFSFTMMIIGSPLLILLCKFTTTLPFSRCKAYTT